MSRKWMGSVTRFGRLLLSASAAILFTSAGSLYGAQNPNAPLRDAQKRLLASMVDSLKREGFEGQFLAAIHGTVVIDTTVGYADSTRRTPVTRQTLYDIASATKSFTAASIISLRDQGRLTLDMELGSLFKNVPPDKTAITVEQLLSHKSGLGTTYAADGSQDRDTAVARLLRQPLVQPVGSRFSYSDDGYVLLAVIVEQLSGMPYETYLQKYLLDPARMRNTSFWGNKNLADPHVAASLQRALPDSILRPQWGQRGSGGLLTNAENLYRWWLALTGGAIVKSSSVAEMMSPHSQANGRGNGWGWFTTVSPSDSRYTRGNEDFGHNALLIEYPDAGVVVAATSNRFKGDQPWTRLVGQAVELLIPRLPRA